MLKNEKYSPLPRRLLRLELSEICNYDCTFCCWRPTITSQQQVLLEPKFVKKIVSAAIASGCSRTMITGGEPLALPENYLLDCIHRIAMLDGLDDFWVLTNGSLLNEIYCAKMREAGLKKIVISIGAASNIDYSNYTRQTSYNLMHILKNVQMAKQSGLHVKIDIPVSQTGFPKAVQLYNLIEQLSQIDVTQITFFELHKTLENKDVFPTEYTSVDNYLEYFHKNGNWETMYNERGQKIAHSGDVDIILPALPQAFNESCKKRHCGHYCQGTYAAYVLANSKVNSAIIRACHRKYRNANNEFEINDNLKKNEITTLFEKSIWKYAYQ